MWGRYDTTAETAGILSGKVWNLDVWLEQAVSADGKQHNRGQEGAGLACVKLEANPGEEYMFRERALGSGAITEIFGTVQIISRIWHPNNCMMPDTPRNAFPLPERCTWVICVILLPEKRYLLRASVLAS